MIYGMYYVMESKSNRNKPFKFYEGRRSLDLKFRGFAVDEKWKRVNTILCSKIMLKSSDKLTILLPWISPE